MTDISKNAELQQSCITDVKSRFFAQYYGQEILRWHQWIETTPDSKVDLSIPAIEKSGWFIKLKSPSNYTKEDAIAVEKIWRLSDERVEAYFLNSYPNTVYDNNELIGRSLIKHWLEKDKLNFRNRIDYRTIQHITDYLRSKGYAVSFMEYSIDDLVSFGWVQLL